MFKRKLLTIYLIILSIVILGWGIGLQFADGQNSDLNYGFNIGYSILYLLASLISLRKAFIFGMGDLVGRGFLYAGLGLLMYTLALWVWSFYNLYLHTEVPYPSLADFLYALFYPLILFSLWTFVRLFSVSISPRLKLEATGVFMTVTILMALLLGTTNFKLDQFGLTTLLNIFYLVADSLIIAMVYIGFRLSLGRFQLGFFLIMLALVAQAGGDLLFTYRQSMDTYWNGDISDLIFALGGVLFGLGLIHMTTSIAAQNEVIIAE